MISRDPAGKNQLLNRVLVKRPHRLFCQHVNYALLEAGCQIILVEFFPPLVSVMDGVDKGALKSAKGKVQVVLLLHCPGEVESVLPLGSPLVNRFPRRVVHAQNPAYLVIGLTSGVVTSFTDDFIFMFLGHVH